jgi:hypothetical protein
VANIGLPQTRNARHIEQGLVTTGDDLTEVPRFLRAGKKSYCAADVIAALLEYVPSASQELEMVNR